MRLLSAPALAEAGRDVLAEARARDRAENLDPAARDEAFARYLALPATTVPFGRQWKRDFAHIALPAPLALVPATALVSALDGVVACTFAEARRSHAAAFASAFGRAASRAPSKFSELVRALYCDTLFVHVPKGLHAGTVEIDFPHADVRISYVLVLVDDDAQVEILDRSASSAERNFSLVEIDVRDRARAAYVALQSIGERGCSIASRRASVAAAAALAWSVADLGADVTSESIVTFADGAGADVTTTGIFFADAAQHVEVVHEVRHLAAHSTSHTVARTAATDAGQGRYLGNIAIAAHTNGVDASLRDDALVFSERAHIDSVPALEIASNDVKAFHGATIGSIDEDALFYAQTRGLERSAAERMIALGFFEPAIERFPFDDVRETLRAAIAAKLGDPRS